MQFIIQPTFSLLAEIEPMINSEIMTFYEQNLRKWQDRKTLETAEIAEAVRKVKKVPRVSEVARFIGQGSIGTAFVCKIQGAQHEVVVKLLFEGVDTKNLGEIKLLKEMSNPHLLKIFDVVCDMESQPLAIIMELCSYGTLWTLVHVAAPTGTVAINLRQRLTCTADVATALSYLHSFLVVHQGVKPSNAFLVEPVHLHWPTRKPMVKLGDPGMVQVRDRTAVYMAPELQEGQTDYDVSCDVFSCSILLHEVVSGQHPYSGQLDLEDPRSQIRIRRGLRPSLEALPAEALKHIQETLTLTWCRDPSNRLTSEQLRQRLCSTLDHLDTDSCNC
jgi:serine/threonine protein kinase